MQSGGIAQICNGKECGAKSGDGVAEYGNGNAQQSIAMFGYGVALQSAA